MTETHTTVAERFEEAGLAANRFVNVRDGEKGCYDHDTRYDDPRDVPGQNYGIYSNRDDQLVILDVDHHPGGPEETPTVAVAALGGLPLSLKMESPHTPDSETDDKGGHWILKLKGDETPAELFKRRFGAQNPVPSWGEVIAKNKYAVGAGSQLDDCDKDWCDECATDDGGRYKIKKDREIAEVDPETLVEALAADPDLTDKEAASEADQTFDEIEGGHEGGDAVGDDRGGSDGGSSSESYDEISKSTVGEMLDEIPGDQHFDDWIRTGYAVKDWDDGQTGKEVFEEWSKNNRKWEREESQRQIDYIWNNDKSRGDDARATVGTLIHLAQKHGWDPSGGSRTPKELVAKHSDKYNDASEVPDSLVSDDWDPDDDATAPEQDADETDTSNQDQTDEAVPGPDWGDVRALYDAAEEEEGITKGDARKAAADVLEAETSWMYVLESERLWVYDEQTGTYDSYGEDAANKRLKEELGSHYAQTERREVIGHLKAGNQTHREHLNARSHDAPLLCVGNGVVDLGTGDLMDHSPEFRFVRGLRWDCDPDRADREPVLEFLDDVTERTADRDTLLDHLAHGLMPGHPYRAFVVCYGPGGNGKTQVSEVFRGFVGEDNAAAVEIDELTDDDFATGDLPGKFINWGDDMAGDGGGTLDELSLLKKATGGSKIRANEKYEKTFDFTNEAAMFFSANEPPRIGEQKRSIQDRIYPIEMPFDFTSDPDPDDNMQKKKVPNISDRLLENDAAMRGLLALAVEHAQDLIESRGVYSQPEDPEERLKKYNKSADPIVRFAGRAVEPAEGDCMIRKDDLYRVYQSFAESWGERAASERGFKRQFPNAFGDEIETGQSRALSTPTDENDRVPCFKRVTWTETAKAKMPDWMEERYSDHFDSGTISTTESEDTDDSAESEPEYVTPASLSVSDDALDREEAPPVRGRLVAIWENRYGQPVAELAAVDGDGTIDIHVEGFDSPDTTPLSPGVKYELDGLRYRKPSDAVPYFEFRPTVSVTTLDRPESDDDADGDGESGTEGGETPDASNDDSAAPAAADGGTESVNADPETSVAGVDVPADATGALADARRIAQYLDHRSTEMAEGALRPTLTADIDGFMTLDEFDAGLERGIEEGLLINDGGTIKPNL